MKVNDDQKHVLVEKVTSFFGKNLAGRTFAVWGIAFKPNTDDIREAPALTIIEDLIDLGAAIQAFDPEAMGHVKAIYGDRITLVDSMYDTLEGADCLAIMTEWGEFRTPDFERMGDALRDKLIFDGRNLYDIDSMKEQGFVYVSMGRPKVRGKRKG